MISINFITGAGLKKCIPITRSCLFVKEAIRVMDMEEVLLAKITSFRVIASRALKTSPFKGMFSTAASMTKSQFPNASSCVVVESF
jgi:hypothetical protein